jgi:hypothetical protein
LFCYVISHNALNSDLRHLPSSFQTHSPRLQSSLRRGTAISKQIMLYLSPTCVLAYTACFAFVSAQLVVPQVHPQQHLQEDTLEQIPIELDFGWHNPEMEGLQPNGPPLLSDILGIDRSLSIFAGLGRSIESIVRPPSRSPTVI